MQVTDTDIFDHRHGSLMGQQLSVGNPAIMSAPNATSGSGGGLRYKTV